MPQHHHKFHQCKGSAKLNNAQQEAEPMSTQLAKTKSNNDKPKNASNFEDTLSKASYAEDNNDETYDDDDEPRTTFLDSDETVTPDFEEKID